MQSQLLDARESESQSDPRDVADLSVDPHTYFGGPVDECVNLSTWGLDPNRGGQVYRHTYIFQVLYKRGDDYGGIQLRARMHTYDPENSFPRKLGAWVERVAHRAAHIFDSTKVTPSYEGYLTGFSVFDSYSNWEHEPVAGDPDTRLGVVDWSTEVYEDDSFDYADLSGIAQGTASPWRVDTKEEGGQPGTSIPGTKWKMTGPQENGYDVHPQGRTAAKERYRKGGAGAGKTIYINDLPVGSLDQKGRTWLTPEYQRGDPHTNSGSWGTYYSRAGLIDRTKATPQALSHDGALYQVDEDEEAVYLVTAREKPPGWSEVDPDQVPVDLEAKQGVPSRQVHLLVLRDPGEPIAVDGVRDDQLKAHLGLSRPAWRAHQSGRDLWPRPNYSQGKDSDGGPVRLPEGAVP